MLSCLRCANIGLQTFPTIENIFMLVLHDDLYQQKRRLRGSPIGTEKPLCRDLLYLVINLMLLSLKHVKTLPFASVYLHTALPNNAQQLARILMSCELLSRRSVLAATERYLVSIATKSHKENFLKKRHLLSSSAKMANHRFASVQLAPESREQTRTAQLFKSVGF